MSRIIYALYSLALPQGPNGSSLPLIFGARLITPSGLLFISVLCYCPFGRGFQVGPDRARLKARPARWAFLRSGHSSAASSALSMKIPTPADQVRFGPEADICRCWCASDIRPPPPIAGERPISVGPAACHARLGLVAPVTTSGVQSAPVQPSSLLLVIRRRPQMYCRIAVRLGSGQQNRRPAQE